MAHLTVISLIFCCILAVSAVEYPIKHVVVLMMENRSYDHMLGWMKAGGEFGNPEVDGLTGKECNFKNPKKPELGKICVSKSAPDNSVYDPDHSFERTTERIFSCDFEKSSSFQKKSTSPCIDHASIKQEGNMGGFAMSAISNGQTGETEMSAQRPEDVPILTTLANEFAQFDKYFASYPGPTNPNRMFLHMGTCDGCVGNDQTRGQVKNRTIQEELSKKGFSWRYYFEDSPEDWFLYIDYFSKNFKNSTLFAPNEQFYQDAASGNLPNYSFLNPSESVNPLLINTKSYGLMNDQHPDHSVREGERLMKNVYEALRNSPQWNQTLFIITYDEHGGFYDHVSPPQEGVPNPDGKKNDLGFNFDRLGERVPMILISPWIEKGLLIKEPAPNQKSTSTSQFEHSSIISLIAKIFGINYKFSARTEWAATFDDLLLTRTQPRTDCPQKLPFIPPPTPESIGFLYNRPLKDRLVNRLKIFCQKLRPKDPTCGNNVKTYKDLNDFITEEQMILVSSQSTT